MESRIWHKFYDSGVPPDVAFEDVALPQWLERAARHYPERPALLFGNGRLSYGELKDQVDRLATALARLGVQRETRVAIQLPNLPQFVIAYYAVQTLGAVAVPTNPIYTPREIEYQWKDADCTVAVLADFIYAQRVAGIRDRLPIRHYLIASIPEYLRFPLNLLAPLKLKRAKPQPLIAKVEPVPNVHPFRRLTERTEPRPPAATIGMDDLSTLLYTGGTTGVSKGVMLTHRNLSYNVQQLRAWFAQEREGSETVLGALPFFHSYGISVMNVSVRLAAGIALLPNPRDIPNVIKAVIRHRVSFFPAVPAMYQAITQYPGIERLDLRSIRICNSGAAPLPVNVLQRFEQLTGARISESFGLTETSPATHFNPLYGVRKVGSVGVPLPGTDQKVVDAEDGVTERSAGEVGELLLHGPQVMSGYWQKPDETAKVLRERWLSTGDLAKLDADGYCFIVGRKKDMIICSGFKVYPDEIDRVLMAHPAILEAASIGIPDQKRGETVKSFIVLRPGQRLSVDEVLVYCREQLAAYKMPTAIEFRSELPKSGVLKILRRELREQELAKSKQTA